MVLIYISFRLGYNFNSGCYSAFSRDFSMILSAGGSLALYSLFQLILTFHLLIVHDTTQVHVPSDAPLRSFVSYSNQDSTIQESSPHKCGHEVWWGTLNMVAVTIPLVMSGLIPRLKFFLYSEASSGDVSLTWSWLASLA